MTNVHVHGEGEFPDAVRQCLEETGQRLVSLETADVVWLTTPTPILNGHGRPDLLPWPSLVDVQQDALVVVSSPVPVGFTRRLAKNWSELRPDVVFAYVPENTRRGHGYEDFRHQERVVVGGGRRDVLHKLLHGLTTFVVWCTWEEAELAKHALNGYLALQATWANELAHLAHVLGADWKPIEQSLRLDARIGDRAYVAERSFDGTHLLRDVHDVLDVAREHGVVLSLASALVARTGVERG